MFDITYYKNYFKVLSQNDTQRFLDMFHFKSCVDIFSFFTDILIFLQTSHFGSNFYGLFVNLRTVGNPGVNFRDDCLESFSLYFCTPAVYHPLLDECCHSDSSTISAFHFYVYILVFSMVAMSLLRNMYIFLTMSFFIPSAFSTFSVVWTYLFTGFLLMLPFLFSSF